MAGGTLTASQADGLPLVHLVRLGTPKRRHSPPRLEWPVVAVSRLMHCSIVVCWGEAALNGKNRPLLAIRA
jgi:hypothetical protein